jgi:Zn-dependent peptidase ImmA (M78 family)
MSELVEKAQALTRALRQQHGNVSAEELARLRGIEIVSARWQVANGRIVYYGECTREPLRIVLNETALEQVAQREQMRELVIAHELGHLLLPRPSIFASHAMTESAAHAFAQAWTNSLPIACEK